ncbi:hypothetical protein [Acinetobacter ursingii]|uniref:hypothetical protein n=1 Tax=Acinetobacter ursingii TaxID=108980 RepID=UPI0021CD6D72|nr:hypothetical protein [Acinetobacter ursingii]MCU4350225.1 hypothetical protein [Acinetobacter ursingii]
MATVKLFRSNQIGAPQLTGRVGKLIDVLDAVLVNGYNQQDVSSLSRVGSIATIVLADKHDFEKGDYCTFGNSTDPLHNGEFLIESIVSAYSFTVAMDASSSNSKQGNMVCKRSPAGFLKPYQGTNKAVYRSANTNSTQTYFQVFDNGQTTIGGMEAGFRMYETMVSTDIGTNLVPTANDRQYGIQLRKSNTQDDTIRHWLIVSDGKTVYAFVGFRENGVAGGFMSSWVEAGAFIFGDFKPLSAQDGYCACLFGYNNNSISSTDVDRSALSYPYHANSAFATGSSNHHYLSSGYDQWYAGYAKRNYLGTAEAGSRLWIWGKPAPAGDSSACVIGGHAFIGYPNPADGSFMLTPIVLTSDFSSGVRGQLPGVYDSFHGRVFPLLTKIPNIIGLQNRTLISMPIRNSDRGGVVYIDITGPWE